MTIKTRETLIAEFKAFLKATNKNLDTGDNALLKDLLIDPAAVYTEAVMDQVNIARNLGILSRISGDFLDAEAANYGLERSGGSFATVVLTFWTTTRPTSDVTIGAGTQAQTPSTAFISPVVFTTAGESVFQASDMDTYYSYDLDRYEFEVRAVAEESGTTSNVGAGTITQVIGNPSNIDGVTNKTAASGGLDAEEDDDLRERIRLSKLGRDLNVPNGLSNYLRSQGFLDAYPVRVESSDSERATGIDAFVIDNTVESVTETITYQTYVSEYYFSNRPVGEVTSMVGSTMGALSNSDYNVFIDSTSPLRRSNRANDYFTFNLAAGIPAGESITVTYTYSPLIDQVQTQLEDSDNNVLTADVLIKKAYPLYLYMTASLTLFANSDGPTVRTQARNALAQYISEYRLGDDVQESDLTTALQVGYGDFSVNQVDAVNITEFYVLDINGVRRDAVNRVIDVTDKEYVVLARSSIV